MRQVVLTAPAKVNLFLGVGGVRSDGYHDVTTILQTLEFADTIRLSLADEFTLTCTENLGIPAENNLAYRAALAFAEEFGAPQGAAIELTKRIPTGAGLGGGSSDAAAVLLGLAVLTGRDVGDERVTDIARGLGADVPFFLAGGAALMSGRGDVIESLLPVVSVPVVLVKPSAPVPTAAAYRAFDADPREQGTPRAVLSALEDDDAVALGGSLENNMTACAIALVPEVGDALAWLSNEPGVLGAAVAGSGSSVFALCSHDDHARRISDDAQRRGLWSVPTATRSAGVTWADD